MEPIKLHINRLGLVRDADLTITPMMIFSGESGLGKSYVAVLCHYFFYVWLNPKRLSSFFKNLTENDESDFTNPNIPDKDEILNITKNDLQDWLAKDAVSYLSYMFGHEAMPADLEVELPEGVPDNIPFFFERELIGVNNAEEFYYKLSVLNITCRFKENAIQDESPFAFSFRYAMKNELFGDYNKLDYDFVLPPSRGSYLSEDIHAKTGLYKSFILGMKGLEQVKEMPDDVNNDLVALLQTVMDGEVKKMNDSYIYITHDESLPASAAASSVREIAPLQMIITKRNIGKVSVLIEEPEAHLHPLKQRMMADIIATMALGGAYMQITTHSDYFLRRINDLLRLDILKSRSSEEEYLKICEENGIMPELTLDSKNLSSYFLEKGKDGIVTIKTQDSKSGIPFDTFSAINGKPLEESSILYELTAD